MAVGGGQAVVLGGEDVGQAEAGAGVVGAVPVNP
jgi:hypothetical protein